MSAADLAFSRGTIDAVPAHSRATAAALTQTASRARRPAAAAAAAPLTQQQLNEEMLKELRAIRQLLEKLSTPQRQPPQPPTAKVTNLSGYALGRPRRAA